MRKLLTSAVLCLGMSPLLAQTSTVDYLKVNSGNGKGVRFWNGSTSYQIMMGNTSEYKYGPVQDYAIKMTMNNDTDRGWVWGINGQQPSAALSTQGHMQIKGVMRTDRYRPSTDDWEFYRNGEDLQIREPEQQNKVWASFKDDKALHLQGTPDLWVDGKIGIGTTSPRKNLHVYGIITDGNDNPPILRLERGPVLPGWGYNTSDIVGEDEGIKFYHAHSSTKNYNHSRNNMTLTTQFGPGFLSVPNPENSNEHALYFYHTKGLTVNKSKLTLNNNGHAYIYGGTGNNDYIDIDGTSGNYVRFVINNSEKFKVVASGNALLNGKFECREVFVTQTPTADFVFEEDYNLRSLEEVETFVKTEKHLPEIASAEEMELNGLNINEFQIQLLQKIEELTLYSIELNKKFKELSEQVSEIRRENEELKSSINDL